MDSAIQRKNMVDSQVRPSDVTDRRIARAMLDVPRERFVPHGRESIAYIDDNLTVGEEAGAPRFLLAPRTLAKMIQALDLGDNAIVLDVGPATGYSTAVLAEMTRRAVAIECDADLARRAKQILTALPAERAEIHTGPLVDGYAARGPYDGILVGGKISDAPPALLNQLKDGARLIAIVDFNGVGKVVEWVRFAMKFDSRILFDADAPMLPGFERAPEFVL